MIKIEIDLFEEKYFVSKYNDERIPNELTNYIFDELTGESLKDKVTLDIYSHYKMTEEEREKYRTMIKKSFVDNKQELEFEIRSSNFNKMILLLIGVLFIFLSYIFNKFGEILDIFGWVAIWEVAYAIMFTDVKKNQKIKRYNQIVNAKINFLEQLDEN